MIISPSMLPLSRLHLTDFRWGDGLAGRADNVAACSDSLRVFRLYFIQDAPTVTADAACSASLVGIVPVNAATLSDHLVISLTGIAPVDKATLSDHLVVSLIGIVPVNAAALADHLVVSLTGIAPVDAVIPTDHLTGDLCAGSVFGRALFGDALFG